MSRHERTVDTIETREDARSRWEYITYPIYAYLDRGRLEGSDLLYIGCGRGILLEYLAEQEIPAVGIDRNLPTSKPDRVSIVQGDAHQLPFRDASFDIVYSLSMFDSTIYTNDARIVQSEVSRVLRTGGLYIIDDPDLPPLHPGLGLVTVYAPKYRLLIAERQSQ